MAASGDYTTIAGFVLSRLGHIPEVDESFEWEGWRFVVIAVAQRRITSILATSIGEAESEHP